MIKNWLLRGDTHGNFLWMKHSLGSYTPEETAIIILGDAGFDFWLNKSDLKKKKEVNDRGYHIYWLRGNHEARPSDVDGYKLIYDQNVHGAVYYDPRFPNLRAFDNFGLYDIGGYSCLVIGGAYSVDKYWRLEHSGMTEETNDPKKTGWFSNEQLTKEEMDECEKLIALYNQMDKKIDFVFSHTCPLSWQPKDLFLDQVDQSTVDSSMEIWMDGLKDKFDWNVWCFGHYHRDRLERPHVEMYYNDIEELNSINNRWKEYDKGGTLLWYLVKSPNFDKDH